MSVYHLLLTEIRFRLLNFVLGLVAVVAAATLFVAGPTLIRGYAKESEEKLNVMRRETASELERLQNEADQAIADVEKQTKRNMRDLGFNLRIIHRNTDLTQLYQNFVAFDMPQEYIQRLADSPEITKIVHLVASLKELIHHNGRPRLLVGFAPEATQSHIEKKSPMGFQIKRGTVFLGHEAGKEYEVDQSIEVLGKTFQVAQILPQGGTRDKDIAIFMHLADAQELLGKPNRITEIVALGCKCKTLNRIEEIRQQLEFVLPEAQVIELSTKAIAREDQRKLVEKYHRQAMDEYTAGRQKINQEQQSHQTKIISLMTTVTTITTPLVVLVCAVWVGLLTWSNVRERRSEIGILRALGKGTGNIASLFMGKAILMGLVGGAVGCGLGYAIARWFAVAALDVSVANFAPALDVLVSTLLGAPLVAAMATYLPTLSAIRQDPAIVLMDQ